MCSGITQKLHVCFPPLLHWCAYGDNKHWLLPGSGAGEQGACVLSHRIVWGGVLLTCFSLLMYCFPSWRELPEINCLSIETSSEWFPDGNFCDLHLSGCGSFWFWFGVGVGLFFSKAFTGYFRTDLLFIYIYIVVYSKLSDFFFSTLYYFVFSIFMQQFVSDTQGIIVCLFYSSVITNPSKIIV